MLCRHLLGFPEPATTNEPNRSFGQVVAQIEDDGGGNRAEAECNAPDQIVRQVGDDEDGDDRRA